MKPKIVDRCQTCGVGDMVEREKPTIIVVACTTKGCPAVYTKKKQQARKK